MDPIAKALNAITRLIDPSVMKIWHLDYSYLYSESIREDVRMR